jgi:hypothetical protein
MCITPGGTSVGSENLPGLKSVVWPAVGYSTQRREAFKMETAQKWTIDP